MGISRTTVVIATRNRAPELERTLRKLMELRPIPPIIVVDNASTDDTVARARGFAPHVVRVERLRRNLAGAARDLGVAAAQTPYVAFCDDDSWWAPDALSLAERTFDEHPRLGLVAGRTTVMPSGRDDAINALMAFGPLGWRPDLPGPSVLGFLGCAAIVRHAAFTAAGGFGRLLRFGAEETLLAYDLAARGWELCYVGDVRACHQPSAHRMSPVRRQRLEARNHLLIAWLRRRPAVALMATAALAAAALRDRHRALALGGALLRLPAALRRRRRLPSHLERDVERLSHDRA